MYLSLSLRGVFLNQQSLCGQCKAKIFAMSCSKGVSIYPQCPIHDIHGHNLLYGNDGKKRFFCH